MAPFTLQNAGIFLAASFHRGALSVTAETGSPMAETGMLSPSFAAVQSASVTIIEPAEDWAPAPAGQISAPAPPHSASHKYETFIT